LELDEFSETDKPCGAFTGGSLDIKESQVTGNKKATIVHNEIYSRKDSKINQKTIMKS
jgi:hypothetical protein